MKVECAYDELVELHKLQPNPRNPNKHPQKQIEMLAKIIDYQGQRAPIVVSSRSGFVTKGHGRLAALQKLGWNKAAVDFQEYDSEAQEHADMIADNKIAELAESDILMINELALEMPEEFDFELLGIEDFSISDFDLEISPPEIPSGDKQTLRQITFTVTEEQFASIEAAIQKSKGYGPFIDTGNENSNGNALSRICETYETIG